ncbi:phosphoenolpyruvate--protein phosphotransferase [Stenotrophomonas rhizophila]|uniref:phosphoenolpyruvate--protein phosphotransferase n=1 Tax=Stenotrophomonas rhizophila TaxID=216778 RepID=UPI001E4E54CB|nr:phosphoenolpyruvate--protein phosphotransferase [Stenotrophomonas rhizophila]MCC7635110.1 phosphoenolpyruvate--protein phosphotransferase [Stenotrophomonas rhizophila]MCC7664874.1 phosphoenolpyruvate--protein phosphotransferase [Stenotrophomonas rhizophila]
MASVQPLQLLAPLSGVLIPLDQVPDPVFAGRVIGDGVCIDPTSQTLCAPLDAVVSELQRSSHAITLTHAGGTQVLLHIGLDTVNLAGQGFQALVEVGQHVQAGQPLIQFDADYIALHARSLMTLMLVISGEPFAALAGAGGDGAVQCRQPLLGLTPAERHGETTQAHAAALLSEPVALPNANGLHARPAAVLVHAAKAFAADIQLHAPQGRANAKSLVAVMGLQTAHGDAVRVGAAGDDAAEAIATLTRLLEAGCGEAVAPGAASGPPAVPAAEAPPASANVLHGVCASAGTAFGQVVQLAEHGMDIAEDAADPAAERDTLQRALRAAAQGLQQLRDSAAGPVQAEVFRTHQELLDDPGLLEQAQALLEQGRSAAFAWNHVTATTAANFKAGGNAFLADRALDLVDVGQRVLKQILGVHEGACELPDQAIVIAAQLTPSQFAALDRRKVVGLATANGGATSHVAILARAQGLPALCGVSAQVLALDNGSSVLLDADRGELHLQPDPALVEQFGHKRRQQQQQHRRDLAQALLPAVTGDGHAVEVTANVASQAEAEQALALGAEGVGLLRSEFLYLQRSSAPSHDEQVRAYSGMARALGPARTLVVRTLDVGGDKPLSYLPMDSEANPFLGIRGIRLCLARPELLRGQLRAILGSAGLARLHIMLPMVSDLCELRLARQMLHEEAAQIGLATPPKLGIMVEVPSAALMADLFASEVDFFSIGTNDLTQYTLAMDRDHPQLARHADSCHPAVLRLIDRTVQAAHAHGKPVAVCGALASEVPAVPLLLGLGVDELSVSVPLIPAIKAAVRAVDSGQCRALARRVLGLESAGQVREALLAYPPAQPVLSLAREG